LPVRCVPLTASGRTEGQVRKAGGGGLEGDTGTGICTEEESRYLRKLGDTKCREVFKFEQEEEVKKQQPKSENKFAGKIALLLLNFFNLLNGSLIECYKDLLNQTEILKPN
jgi:hypothetical protein